MKRASNSRISLFPDQFSSSAVRRVKEAVCIAIVLLVTWAVPAGSQNKDCPDCPKTAPTSVLDPKWKEFTPPPLAPGELPDCHRVQFGKQNCNDCHQKETPTSYNQWLGSRHGINSVKCGICHGDVNNYRARPDKVACMGGQSAQVHNMPAQALVTNCSFCHKSHWFTVHKIGQYEKFSPGREQRFKVPGF
ncbi:MAG: hypothetical protein HY912_00250 [Desulfomonile tiedjei]|uniref:Uncharacterized protein n=1 Tax=Desulfomonile tiedjei TaxID=2358 RepID=A0A9D6V239_9BACT|nr:hypothetical protein [Desulfomonile tiedjei]